MSLEGGLEPLAFRTCPPSKEPGGEGGIVINTKVRIQRHSFQEHHHGQNLHSSPAPATSNLFYRDRGHLHSLSRAH